MPHCPYFLNLNGGLHQLARAGRSVLDVSAGKRADRRTFSNAGLGSKQSIVEQPPFIKRKITRLTRCG